MAVKLGNGNWAVKEDKLLAYNDNSGLFFNKEFDFSRGTSATYVAKDGLIKTAGIQPNIVNNGDFSELGSELVTNGTFETDSDWTKGTGWSIADGRASYDGLNGTQQIFSNTGYSPVVGKTYKITFNVLNQGDGNNTASFGGVVFSNTNLSVNSYEFYVTAISTGRFGIFGRDGGVFSIDNVSVKQVDPNDYWTLGTGWSFGDNRATSNASTNSYLNQQVYEIGKTYKLGFEVLEGTIELRSAQYSKGTGFYTTGTYSIEVIPTTTSTHFYVYTGFGQSSITNITVQEIQTDTPRIDFTNDTKGHLLLEPSRTNLITYSEDFSQWGTVNGAVVTDNFTTSPDGTQNAAKVVYDGTSLGRIEISTGASGTNTQSIYLKTASGTQAVSIGASSGSLTEVTVTSEWQRFTHTGSGNYPRVLCNDAATIYAWGAQLESGDYSTSLIPTTGAASTRNADVCNNSGSAQDFNSEEGVLYAELSFLESSASATNQLSLSDGSSDNRIMIYPLSNTQLGLRFNANGSQLVTQTVTVSSLIIYSKIAIKWGNGNYSLYQNGSEIYTQTIASTPIGLDKLNLSSVTETSNLKSKVRNVQVFTEALTDEQLEKLTS